MTFLHQFPADQCAPIPYKILFDARLSPGHVATLTVLMTHANDKGQAWGTDSEISKLTNTSLPETSSNVDYLEKLGYLIKFSTRHDDDLFLYQTVPSPLSVHRCAERAKEVRAKLEQQCAEIIQVRYANGSTVPLSFARLAFMRHVAYCLKNSHDKADDVVPISEENFRRHGIFYISIHSEIYRAVNRS